MEWLTFSLVFVFVFGLVFVFVVVFVVVGPPVPVGRVTDRAERRGGGATGCKETAKPSGGAARAECGGGSTAPGDRRTYGS
ncbi:hypothetical protein [Streptomyces sp. NPDC007264]|uniref:hypothetical protein n=1 Tax=Streptomyces sp. NPDC007264 TaxID=3364777 RepID=UPI0036DD2222